MPQHNTYRASPDRLRAATGKGLEVDFYRAKFNVSAREVEKAIQQAGNSPEKVEAYFRNRYRGK